ncbi:MAG: hypothetical protein J3R72DRAFT_14492 [Linnemannia gamsii]|nr:MAG: hypothetical protein J3R72DRAFT_14492 [Linnemannia gamsii]
MTSYHCYKSMSVAIRIPLYIDLRVPHLHAISSTPPGSSSVFLYYIHDSSRIAKTNRAQPCSLDKVLFRATDCLENGYSQRDVHSLHNPSSRHHITKKEAQSCPCHHIHPTSLHKYIHHNRYEPTLQTAHRVCYQRILDCIALLSTARIYIPIYLESILFSTSAHYYARSTSLYPTRTPFSVFTTLCRFNKHIASATFPYLYRDLFQPINRSGAYDATEGCQSRDLLNTLLKPMPVAHLYTALLLSLEMNATPATASTGNSIDTSLSQLGTSPMSVTSTPNHLCSWSMKTKSARSTPPLKATWCLTGPILEQLESLTFPLSDIRRHIQVIGRLGRLERVHSVLD